MHIYLSQDEDGVGSPRKSGHGRAWPRTVDVDVGRLASEFRRIDVHFTPDLWRLLHIPCRINPLISDPVIIASGITKNNTSKCVTDASGASS